MGSSLGAFIAWNQISASAAMLTFALAGLACARASGALLEMLHAAPHAPPRMVEHEQRRQTYRAAAGRLRERSGQAGYGVHQLRSKTRDPIGAAAA